MSSIKGKIVTINSKHVYNFPTPSRIKRLTATKPLLIFIRFDSGLGMPMKLSRGYAINISNYVSRHNITLASGTKIKAIGGKKDYITRFTEINGHLLKNNQSSREAARPSKRSTSAEPKSESNVTHTETLAQLENKSSNASKSPSSLSASSKASSTSKSSTRTTSQSSVASSVSSEGDDISNSSSAKDMPASFGTYRHIMKSNSGNSKDIKKMMNNLVSKSSHDVYVGLKKVYNMEHWHSFDTNLVAHGGKSFSRALKSPLTKAYISHALKDNIIPDNLNQKHIHHKKHKKPLHDVNIY